MEIIIMIMDIKIKIMQNILIQVLAMLNIKIIIIRKDINNKKKLKII
jgi:hypothetical protein